MTDVLQSASHFPSPSSSSTPNGGSHPLTLINGPTIDDRLDIEEGEEGVGEGDRKSEERDREGDQLSLLTLLVAAFRKSLIRCSTAGSGKLSSMEIGRPSNVRHVAHVTFDRFHGFLGLPVEFEPEVPRRAPSASANVFGVSTESMQLSFDARGNSVPTILLMMQRQLYAQGGLQAEGIFRINAENSQEEYVREQLNRGVIPANIDVHCLAGLIKAWFRELPTGVLDTLSPEQVMQSQSEDECTQLVRLLPSTEAALMDWAINLMSDVAQLEYQNKMNAHNVAMVFAPNMTQMADPLTALMYAVQVMNFLKTLIVKTLREREESRVESPTFPRLEPSDEDGYQSSSQLCVEGAKEEGNSVEERVFGCKDPAFESPDHAIQGVTPIERGPCIEIVTPEESQSLLDTHPCEDISQVNLLVSGLADSLTGLSGGVEKTISKSKTVQSSLPSFKKGSRKVNEGLVSLAAGRAEKTKGPGIVGRINSRTELFEAWR
ncbi:hypothetical protein I3843_10G011200 [Carya illinoinensis]|uniref:Uncharacterized protein n=1 Tax=Carya illinoinensis TaxID=32201 RepID=A0A8T1P7B7_CARIL|nr:rho GTPase-activating protein 5 [Carya illinoinensis]KAG6638088.1 hypothetical protein CIPAW_10G011100 [Carya illinoinensis]KAG7958257.1 hypothetical protein I3843_10G011200 [Carya illinoinensis]